MTLPHFKLITWARSLIARTKTSPGLRLRDQWRFSLGVLIGVSIAGRSSALSGALGGSSLRKKVMALMALWGAVLARRRRGWLLSFTMILDLPGVGSRIKETADSNGRALPEPGIRVPRPSPSIRRGARQRSLRRATAIRSGRRTASGSPFPATVD